MADFLKGLFGGAAPSAAPSAVTADADFADFAGAPAPTPVDIASSAALPPSQQTFGPGVPFSDRPYTKWYNVQERVSVADFYAEMFILPVIIILAITHMWGTRANRSKAKTWMSAHAPALTSEFTSVGFNGSDATSSADVSVDDMLKEKSKDVFLSYGTGRQNVAFVDVKLNLYKRYNPLALFGDAILGFFFESMPAPSEKAEITVYPFDGREKDIAPRFSGEKVRGSAYDGFVWAIVHKDLMKKLREDRYDLSLTITKENAKLPAWATVMSESAEISDTLLTPDLIKAIEACGDDFESLIVTDMPEDAPKTLDDLQPKKRLSLNLRLATPANGQPSTLPVLQSFLRIPDVLVNHGHFRPEVMRRVKATRDEETKKIRKLDEQEKAEGRKTETDKQKKEERERKLKGMSAEEQRKYLEKEREKDQRRSMGRKTVKA